MEAVRDARDDSWPNWCRVPSSAVQSWLAGHVETWTLDHVGAVPLIAGLTAWRCGRQIVVFHDDLWDALTATPLNGDLPAAVLLELPAWGFYIAMPRPIGHIGAQGAYVWLDIEDGDPRLYVLVDREGGRTLTVPVRLSSTIIGSIDAARADLEENRDTLMGLAGESDTADAFVVDDVDDDQLVELVSGVVAAALYLCSAGADLVDRSGRSSTPRRPPRPRADAALVWEAGWRVGSALRAARGVRQAQGGSHASPRTHLRNAHWHHYWVGPRTGQRLELRWIGPKVIAGDADGLPTAIVEHSTTPR